MNLFIEIDGKIFKINTSKPLDISIPLHSGNTNPNAFGLQVPLFKPVQAGAFIGSVAQGGSVNCEDLFLNAHGNGTHTECAGHITNERMTINQCLKEFVFLCHLVSVPLQQKDGDTMVTLADVKEILGDAMVEALVIRTLPNDASKVNRVYSGNNPPYLESALCEWLRNKGVKHLLIDLPSVDRESDDGALAAHHAFWNHPAATRMDATITEMVFVPNHIRDGFYLLNIQIASLETDASPSKPVLYQLEAK